jgi:CDP-diacylglycerol pyrophosphatase
MSQIPADGQKRPGPNVSGKKRRVGMAAAICAFGVTGFAAPAGALHSNALWHVVHDLCVTDARLTGLPAPCLAVNRKIGYAVLDDPGSATQVLLVPTTRIHGIESPRLLDEGAPNYWQSAWNARRFLERHAGGKVAREDIAMAINSVYGRSQEQLHIHIDCVQPDVKAKLAAHEAEIGEDWSPFAWDLAGERYVVRRLDGAELGDRDPFKLLARDDPGARAGMGAHTLAVIGARFADGRPGFILLTAVGGVAANPKGASEGLLDHDCAVLHPEAMIAP